MKKNNAVWWAVALTVAVVAAVLLFAGRAGRRTVVPEFAAVACDTTLQIGPLSYAVRYDFASIANARRSEVLETIQRANLWYFFQLEEFDGTPAEAAERSVAQIVTELTPMYGSLDSLTVNEYYLSASSTAELCDSVLIYTIRRFSYEGGAHPMHQLEIHNYRLSDGYEFQLADLFTEGQQAQLTERIREKLYYKYVVAEDPAAELDVDAATMNERLYERGFFPDLFAPSENFALTPQGIIFYYNPYDLAAYFLGSFEVPFSPAEVVAVQAAE